MIDLTVKTLDSQNHAFSLEDDQITVRGFKEYIAESVAVPADSQRLIYCGRVLQDEKKLRDYDVNGKVIHLVQRAPPRPGQRRNDGGQNQSHTHGSQAWQNPQRTHYRLTRTQMHGNAMYLGAMSVPAEIVEGHGLSVPQLSNSLSNSRLIVARRMLDRANALMDRLDDPTCPLNPPSSDNNQPPLAQQVQVQQLETEHYNNEGRTNGSVRLAEAAAAAIAAALSAAGANNVTLLRGNSEEGGEAGSANDTNDDNQSNVQQSQSEQQVSTSSSDSESTERRSRSRNDTTRRTQRRGMTEAGTANLIAGRANNVTLLRGNSDGGVEAMPVSGTSDANRSNAQQSQNEQQVSTSSSDSESTERSQPHIDETRRTQCRGAMAETNLIGARASNVTLLRGTGNDGGEARAVNDQSADAQQSQPSQSEQLPRPPQMAELLERLLNTQDRLRPYIERYRVLMRADPSLPPGAGPEGVEENQRIVDGVSESLHYMSHACHALSDIIVDMGQQPPRNLRCRPIIIQHSAILQPGIPIQVEAHISVHGRNANNNNGSEENGDSASGPAQSESNEASAGEGNEQQEAESTAQQQSEQQQEQSQSPFGTVFNLPNNVQVLMEVSPEGNVDAASGSEPAPTGENNNNNNNNGGRTSGTAGTFPWGSAPPTDFIRNLMQAVAGHMVQGGITTTTITTQNPPTVGGQQATSSVDESTNVGQSTLARSNVGTHPTTATQTRSTSRPHVFHQQAHPLGVGMSIGQGLDFDPFLPCNSHHVRRTSTSTSSTVTSTSQGTRTSQAPTTETQSQAQTATTSTTTSNTSSTNTTPVTTSQSSNGNLPFMNFLRQVLGSTSDQAISINSNNPDVADSVGSMMQMLNGRNIHVGIIGDRGTNPPVGTLTLAELLLPFSSISAAQNARNEGNFFMNLSVLMLQNMTLMDLIRLRVGDSEPIAHLRRPLQEFFQNNFPNTTTDVQQEQATERLMSHIRPHLHNLLMSEEDSSGRSGSRIDICATIEALLRRHIKEILQYLLDNDVTDARFGQETINTVNNGGRQLCAVLRYSIRGGQAGLEAIVSRCLNLMLEGSHPMIRHWMLNVLTVPYRAYLLHVAQPPDSEILPLLIYKEVPSQQSTGPSGAAHQASQSDAEPMETEMVDERANYEASVPDDGEEIPETFPGHEALPSDWVPIIARDGVRQRRQLQMQGMNGGVATFSDAYLGTLPTKRRKLIEQQKPRLLVSPTPNHSAIAASMERLVREGVNRAGVEEVEGAAVAVAVDPGVRRAFGQAIRDCLNPRRYGTPDFPDPLRFPNATKYFADQDRKPK